MAPTRAKRVGRGVMVIAFLTVAATFGILSVVQIAQQAFHPEPGTETKTP